VSRRYQRDDGQSDCFRLALNDRFDSLLQPLDLLDRIGACYVFAADWLEISHQISLHSTC
jgi:hypothetical protein